MTPNTWREKKKHNSKSLQWAMGLGGIIGLALLAIIFFQSFYNNPPTAPEKPAHQDQLNLLSERITKELGAVRKSYQQLEITVKEVEDRLTKLEKSTIFSSQIEELRNLIASQTLELLQIKSRLKNEKKNKTKSPVTILSSKVSSTKEPHIYHTVSPGETIFSISRQYGMTVEGLLHLNKLPKRTTIYSSQQLLISPPSPESKTD